MSTYNSTNDLIKCVSGGVVLGSACYMLNKMPINTIAEKYYDANPPKIGQVYRSLVETFGSKRIILSAITFTGAYLHGNKILGTALINYFNSKNYK